jgi:hypothetical protein
MMAINNTAKDIVFWGILLFMIGTITIMGWQAWYPYDPVTFNYLSVDKSTVCRGQELCYTIDADKNLDVPAKVAIEMANGENILIMTYDAHMPVGHVRRKKCFVVPYHVKPEKYRISWTGTYEVSPFQYVRKTILSDIVEVK